MKKVTLISTLRRGAFLRTGKGAVVLLVCALIIAACGSDKPEPLLVPPANTPVIDISGVWAGTWSGTDPGYGQVSGDWEAEVSQTSSTISGTGSLGGDVDCMDASAVGSLDASNVVSGTLTRDPCPHNEWTMTALNLLERSTSGTWTKPSSGGSGTFAGVQIAQPGGPRIRFLSPPGGLPGTIVTIVGTGFGPAAADNALDFNAKPAGQLLTASATTLVARVPYKATTGQASLTNAAGTAMSPRPFNTSVTFPAARVSRTIPAGSFPESMVFSPDGRKVYVTNRNSRSVSMISTATNYTITTTILDAAEPVQGIAASPDGRRVYAANGASGIRVLDAAKLTVVDTFPVNAGGGTQPNPLGLAISPDGKLLYVSDNHDGGAVTVLDSVSGNVVASLVPGAGATPLGVAPSPDGTRAYIAVAGPNELVVFDPYTNSVVDTIAVGSRPSGVAVTPNGVKVYVTNELGNSVSVYDTALEQITTKTAGTAPTGIAISPDGSRVHVVNKGSNTVSIMSAASDQIIGTITVGSGPVGIAIGPDGKRAYVTNSAGASVSELGGPLTLTITKSGTGMGTVTSSPEGISCGGSCQARYDYGTVVHLTATGDSGSYFSYWSGDCYGSSVTMDANKTCTAVFARQNTGGGGGGGGGGNNYYYYGGCYIATAAFGSADEPHVKVLADFHDKYFTSNAGRAVTTAYHRYAPPIADYISRHETVRCAIRTALLPVVYAIRYPLGSLGVFVLFIAASLEAKKRRRACRDQTRPGHEREAAP